MLVQHHIHYKEIHGFDEIVEMSKSEHTALHKRLRKEGKCNIPADELRKISCFARGRTEKAKRYRKEYYAKNRQRFTFYDTVATNIKHCEEIAYNLSTGYVSINCRFIPSHDKKLWNHEVN